MDSFHQSQCCRLGVKDVFKVRNSTVLYSVLLSAVCRANDGCLYVFDLEQNKRTLKVSVSVFRLLL